MISVIIPSYNRNDSLRECVVSLRKNSHYDSNEIIILHPESDAGVPRIAAEFGCRAMVDGSRDASGKRVLSLWGIINRGIEAAKNQYVCWLNDDCRAMPEWDRYALTYFSDPNVGLVVMRSKGIGGGADFGVIEALHGVPCANYGVLDRTTGARFDERYSWFYGDADLPLQLVVRYRKLVQATRENCIVHNHLVDKNRAENEGDPRVQADRDRFVETWGGFTRLPAWTPFFGKIVRRNPVTRVLHRLA